jgi:hypothetical protein
VARDAADEVEGAVAVELELGVAAPSYLKPACTTPPRTRTRGGDATTTSIKHAHHISEKKEKK